jgi:hypothetical protein
MVSQVPASRTRDIVVLGAFWVATFVLINQSSAPLSFWSSVAVGLIFALGGYALVVLLMRPAFLNAWPAAGRVLWGVGGIIVLGTFFFGGTVMLGRLFS